MGGKKGISVPKLKVSAPKAIASAIGKATNPISGAISGAGKGLEKLTSAVSKGDFKGAAGAGMGLLDTAKDLAKNSALQNLSLGTGAMGALGSLTGSKDISKLAKDVNAEGERGVAKYGDAAIDVGANVATGGTYGVAKQATESLASGGLKGLVSGKGLQDAALGAAGSYAGVDPDALQMAKLAAKGDLKGAALQKIAGSTGVNSDILKQVSTGKFDVKELAKNANLTASLGGAADAYMPGSAAMLNRAGEARDQVRAIQDVQKAAQSTYKIAKGDTLAAIAKKMGVDPKALAAANNIKDPNKIAAGMNLKMPESISKMAGVAGNASKVTDKYMKDASGKTIYGPNNAPIPNPTYNREEADKLAIKTQGGESEEGFLDKAGDFFGGLKDKAGDFFEGAGDKISGAVSSAGSFLKENPMLATGAIQAGAATAGYMAGDKAREEQEKLLEKQILDTKGIKGLQDYKLTQEREKAYGEQQQFYQDRIAGGGMTAKETEMRQQGQDRAARAAAAGRLAGVEQQARMGQGATGAGAGLAASLAGAQAQSNVGAESERAVATSAAQNLEQAYNARPAALESKAKTEIDLARMQDQMALNKVQEIGDVRTAQGTMAAQEGEAQGRLAAGLADIATRGVLGQQIGPSDATAKEREIAAQAQADKEKALQSKANAAGAVSQSAPTQGNVAAAGQPAPAGRVAPQTQADKFNQAGQAPQPTAAPQPGQGQGYGVLASSKAPNPMDAMMNIVKNPAQAAKNPAQAVKTVQQVAKNPQIAIDAAKKKAQETATAAAKKAVGSVVPNSLKNIIKF